MELGCIWFAWEGFGSRAATAAVLVRSCIFAGRTCDPMEALCWNCSPDGLHLLEETHAGEAHEELQPTGRTHVKEVHGGLSPLGETPQWGRGRV